MQEAGLLSVENMPDHQAGTDAVPFELDDDLNDVEDQMEQLGDDDMPDLEELPPHLIIEKDDDSRVKPPPVLTSQEPPDIPPELPRRSSRNPSK